jgi:hypothetical protein
MNNNKNNTIHPAPRTAFGRMRKWARFDLPVIRPSTTRAELARKLV